ncbi:kinase-like protein [Aspergillus uvarum CBS 121591]|uniref:Kinase-like protein n=1 Tax=Aspergillus uvarum CBS 121591 TaxID=1448315 RepID=A0A319CMW2_9EURO|nr:kinase-like protein [Aspergillus uvarum CBS 121591]PYH85920.1 kinase-like protein [Aspergillus uvarum CBS 121591]
MSMFRKPSEISSSSSSDEEVQDLHISEPRPEVRSKQRHQPKKKGILSPTSAGDSTDVDGHGKMMTAALLEFYCVSRAADLLNAQPGSHGQYNRDSPEARALGHDMYTRQSEVLSQHGIVNEGAEKEALRPTRQLYRDTLDLIASRSFKRLDLHDLQSRSASVGGALPKTSSELTLHKGRSGHTQLERNAKSFNSLQELDIDHLFNPRLAPFLEMSRYALQFEEISVLGRGAFGEVYHVRNHVDEHEYAIKKIALSRRRLAQLEGGNKHHLGEILKEIRTLAKLDHANIVRYYGAWAEKNLSHHSMASQMSMVESQNKQLAIVFEESETSASGHALRTTSTSKFTSAESMDDEDDSLADPSISHNPTQDQPSSFRSADEDIFTDGLSHNPSSMQILRSRRRGLEIPAVILHIQMSMHPISLHAYLSPRPSTDADDSDKPRRRHCFHLVPSLQLMIDILSGVLYLHSKDIIHRDLKPANIFLSCPEKHHTHTCCHPCQSDGGAGLHYCQPRIGDFGLVADISHLNDPPSDGSPQSPEPGSTIHHVVGTEFYRPPLDSSGLISSGYVHHYAQEVGTERPMHYVCDWSLDVYSLGIILFELLYPLNTKMERHLVLDDLTKGPYKKPPTASINGACLPRDFMDKVHMGDVKLKTGNTVAEALASCIGGMLDPHPRQRWRCEVVQKCLREILATVHPDSY